MRHGDTCAPECKPTGWCDGALQALGKRQADSRFQGLGGVRAQSHQASHEEDRLTDIIQGLGLGYGLAGVCDAGLIVDAQSAMRGVVEG
jgi:hypothetical protein